MTTINLYQNQSERDGQASASNVNKGFFFSLGIFGLVILIFLGLKFYASFVEKKNAELDQTIESENAKLVGLKDLEQVVDIQKRTDAIKKNLKIVNGKVTRVEINKVVDMIGAEMSDGVFVSSLEYKTDGIVVKFSAANFNDASRQIFNFKKSENFASASMSEISRGEEGVAFGMNMTLKQ